MSSVSTVSLSPLSTPCNEWDAFYDDYYNIPDALNAAMTSPQGTSSSTFYRNELHRALEEQKFGISSYKLGQSSALEANAQVVLLEGTKITIVISIRGYQVRFARTNSSLMIFVCPPTYIVLETFLGCPVLR